MIGEKFEILLDEFGKLIKVPLKPDKFNCCSIKFKGGLIVQLEPDKRGYFLHIATEIIPLPQGKFRENVLREALKANGLPPPRNGIFSFSKKKDSLILYERAPLETATGQNLVELLTLFCRKAQFWKESLQKNQIPSFTENELTFAPTGGGAGGLFGLVK